MIEAKDLNYFTLCFSGSFPQKPWWKKFAMNAIKKITKSKWTHVSFVYPENDVVMCQEATTPTIQKLPLYVWLKYPRHEWEIWELNNISIEEEQAVLDYLWDTYGSALYGEMQLIFALFSYLFRTKNLVTKGIVCSEYVMSGIEQTPLRGYLSEFYDPDTISPQDIYQMIKLLEKVGIAKMIERVGVL